MGSGASKAPSVDTSASKDKVRITVKGSFSFCS